MAGTKIIMKGFADVYQQGDGTSNWVFNMEMWGGAIPNSVETSFPVTVNVDDDTLTQIGAKAATAARAYATSKGITVAAGKVFLLGFNQA